MVSLLLLFVLGFMSSCVLVFCAKEELAICVVAKEEPDIIEWIEYHLRMGVAKIILYDNSGRHNKTLYRNILWFVKNKYVIYEAIEGLQAQPRAYRACTEKYASRFNYLAFIDMDEFIVVPNPKLSVPTLLKSYEEYGALGMSVMEFGRNGFIARPDVGVLQSYNACHPVQDVKIIANTKYFTTGKFVDPQQLLWENDKYTVNEAFERIDSNHTTKPSYQKIYINHYIIKSIEDFGIKHHRGNPWSPDGHGRPWPFLIETDAKCTQLCPLLKMPEPNSRQ